MTKIDMHVHTAYSERPSEWFLQKIGAKESYIRPEDAFNTALNRGMDYVTITDHNCIDGAEMLKELYPQKAIIGVETTTYFPEDQCKIHLLIYGIDRKQFAVIQEIRNNIYDLCTYLYSENIAHSVAHATYAVNRKLSVAHLEKLILLFDCFEGLNGARSVYLNLHWMNLLKEITPAHIDRLQERHGIVPASHDPWNKAFTGGSDDHSGLFIGRAWTETEAGSPEAVLEALRNKQIRCYGKHNDYKNLAFSIYKIALDFAREKNGQSAGSLLFAVSEQLFATARRPSEQTMFFAATTLAERQADPIGSLIRDALAGVKAMGPENFEDKFDFIYDKVSDLADEYFKRILETIERDLTRGDIANCIMKVSSSLSGVFLVLPFLSALEHLYSNRAIINGIRKSLALPEDRSRRKILWFTDTISDLNGVAETLRDVARISQKTGQTVKVVAAFPEYDANADMPPKILFVPTFYSMKIPMYENLSLHFPSLLKSIEQISREEPTEIFISTPGPIGLLGLLTAKLLKLKCTGIYHTDFTRQLEHILTDSTLPNFLESGMRWFYSMTDVIKVATEEYIHILAERGYEPKKLQLIPKGIDPDLFRPDHAGAVNIRKNWGFNSGITLLYAGRVSKDKNLDFLCNLYRTLAEVREDLQMVIVGDGPDLDELRDVMQPFSKVLFTGRVKREILPSIYSAADLFMFPSTTDTFGMVVLEAQACGLPAIVSDVGGPQEIIKNGRTGFVARHNSLDDWFVKTQEMIALIQTDPAAYTLMKRQARRRAMIRHGKTSFFDQVDVSAVTSQKYANGEPARRNQRPRNRTAGTSHILEAGSLSG